MKKSMMIMMMMVIVFSMNLFGEIVNEKAADHVCTAECKHEEVKKECDANCMKPCCADKKVEKNHVCTEKGELAINQVCTDECKLDETNKTCELAMLKNQCSSQAKDDGCKPAGCDKKVVDKDCQKQ